MTIFDFIKRERETGRWCCLRLTSDYNFCWILTLIEDEFSKMNPLEASKHTAKHEPSIYIQFEDEVEGLIKAEEALKEYNETGNKVIKY